MNEEYGANFITVTDEDGHEYTLEHIDTLELDDITYLAFFPATGEDEDIPEEELGLILMKVVTENGEELLSTLDSDEESEKVYNAFMEQLFEEEDS